MRKIKLAVESLDVQSFATSSSHAAEGTVVAYQQTMQGQHCGSAYDACHTGLCTPNCAPTYSPEACPTQYPQYC
ncbi:hypothetical protein [Longimicrobium sp.]|uniref:hypothetical protein n=1 Tax=Longimicrobium sp. TaxID=2029185 RepID=UPI002B5E4AA5|nr:hypothetical protein [Longimicrobium sp.]HSU12873.1 hypothetical protein [Longimicrobium sp.]